ncbi:nitrate ABC transporter substrate-binding protein [Azorhizobium oxalatiphilum]|uniref:Nitrate ABC transporter substrate-binding protein n=1 Tax=Azorhizobium oxalatiphilum TaxID=980631 RepID=A0A917F8T6_9HYPH|nr:ABC transporter substrate-binding protein [Azorhizobium oxalatiphilum]GGF58479.1 nitrate ABC transporter substrate-binding protein [Azorhizobium oxalatiphilum]
MTRPLLSRRTFGLALSGLLLAGAALAPAQAQTSRVKLLIGFQDTTLPETVAASKVLEGTPYDVEWVILPGPAAQLSALYSKAIDVGHMGDTSLIIEQGKARTPWTAENVPLQIVAGWRATDAQYPPIITVTRTDARIETLADLRGKRWAYNFGGFNYLQYVLSLQKAGLKPADIQPIQLGDQSATSAAFNAGRADVYSGNFAAVAEAVERGDAKPLLTSDQLDIPALNVFTARGDVVRDRAKSEALADFLARVRRHWDWYAANLDTVEKIYTEKVKQSPARAKISTVYLKATFRPLDDAVIAREQAIADVLVASGDLPRKIDVSLEFNRAFNAATTGGN